MNKLNGKITANATLRGAMTRGAGGGTYVEANPEGEATGTLEKLMVEDEIFEIRNVPDASSAHNGDVLTKITSGVAWLPQIKELPTYTSGDNGKVLKIVNGTPTWTHAFNYSTYEQEIGTWIDGKNLYQKTIDFGAMPARGNSKSVAHNISGADIIISVEAFGIDTSGEVIFVPNVSRGNATAQTSISVDKTYVYIYNGSSSDITNAFNGYITIKYTKEGE